MDQAIANPAPPPPAPAVEARGEAPARPGRPARGGLIPAAATLWQREMVRFFRQRNRVVGALAMPVIFWLMLGSGLDRAFVAGVDTPAGADATGYLAYLFPGTLVMILLFTAIFSTITVIEDRREGFLQAVLVAPVPRLAIVLGKVLGGAGIATLQGVVFLALWPWVGTSPGWEAMLAAAAAMFVVAAGLTAMSLAIAWPMDSTAGFHAVMNLLLLPMWFLSGALFPVETAPPWMAAVMRANPLTYGHALIASLLHGAAPAAIPTAVTLGFTFLAVAWATRVAARPQKA